MNQRKLSLKELHAEGIDDKEFNRGLRYIDDKKPLKAVAIFKRMLKVKEYKEAWLNLGVAYKWVGDYDKVRECFLKAADPKIPFSDGKYVDIYPTATINLGLPAYTFEQDDTAIQFYKHVLEKDPLNYEAIWNLSLATLRRFCSGKEEDLARAWTYYTYRFKRNGADSLKNDNPNILLWDMKTSYPEDDIIIFLEQGHGDTLMFGRYVAEVAKHFRKVFVQCIEDMDWLFTDYNVCRATSETTATFAVPMASLGKLFDHIPEGTWLKHKFTKKVPNGVLDIGCIWQGSKSHVNDRNRSAPAGYFDRLKKFGNLYTIGPGEPRKGYTHLPGKNWADTAKNLEKLDLVITIDSSVAHFCGSVGMPCLVLMPLLDCDFRWGDKTAGRNNVWYDSVEVIRNPRDWTVVFAEVEEMLKCWK